MSSAKDDEDYWYSSEKRSFSFESNEPDPLFGVSKAGTARLRAEISSTNVVDDELKSEDTQSTFKPLLSVISEKTLACILATDKMQRQAEEVSLAQPDITLRRILLGQPFTLEQYKSMQSKSGLLDAAIESGDGNAILIVVLFITKTLKRSLVQRLLIDRPEAVHVYVNYLSTRLQCNEITDLLTMLGKSTDSAMKNLHIIIKNTGDPQRLLQKLLNCYKTQFSTLTNCRETTFLQKYIKLLEWQVAVKDKFTDPLEIDSSVLKSLEFTCKDHWGVPENSLLSPVLFSQHHDISSGQFQKTALFVRASAGAWDDIDKILLGKGWLGSRKLQTSLPIEEVLKLLYSCNAPTAVLEKYLKYMDDIEDRLEIAKRLKCFKIVIETYAQQGDRASLLEYKSQLQPQSEEYFFAESALRSTSVRWKN